MVNEIESFKKLMLKARGLFALFILFQGGQRKKDRKIALLSFYLLYLYHV